MAIECGMDPEGVLLTEDGVHVNDIHMHVVITMATSCVHLNHVSDQYSTMWLL